MAAVPGRPGRRRINRMRVACRPRGRRRSAGARLLLSGLRWAQAEVGSGRWYMSCRVDGPRHGRTGRPIRRWALCTHCIGCPRTHQLKTRPGMSCSQGQPLYAGIPCRGARMWPRSCVGSGGWVLQRCVWHSGSGAAWPRQATCHPRVPSSSGLPGGYLARLGCSV